MRINATNWIRYSALLLLLAGSLVSLTGAQDTSPLETGNARLEDGAYDLALEAFNTAIEQNPDEAAAYLGRGQVYHALSQRDDALADFTQAIDLDPDLAAAYRQRAAVYREMRRYDDSLADWTTLIDLEATATHYAWRGDLLRLTGDYDGAVDDFETALELDPESALVYRLRSQLWNSMANAGTIPGSQETMQQAVVNDLNRAVELGPDDPETYNARGEFLLGQGALDVALSDFEEAIALDADFAPAYRNMGNVYGLRDQMQEAMQAFDTAIELDSYNADGYFFRANLLGKEGQFERAIEDLTRAHELDPYNEVILAVRGDAYRLLAVEYTRAGQDGLAGDTRQRAIADYTAVLAVAPGDAGTYYRRALAYLNDEQLASALADLEQYETLVGAANVPPNVISLIQQLRQTVGQ